MQQKIAARASMDVSYFRRWYGNFTVTDNLTIAPTDFDPFNITAPVDSRLIGPAARQAARSAPSARNVSLVPGQHDLPLSALAITRRRR